MMWSLGTGAVVVSVTGGTLLNGSVPAAWRRGLWKAWGFLPPATASQLFGSGFDLVAGLEHPEADPAERQHQARRDGRPDRQRALRLADEAVAEAVDQIEERIELGERAERLGQALHQI